MAYNGYYSNRPQKEDKWSPEEDTAGKTETFVTRNVKLITFLVCLGLFLVFFGPWSVMRIKDWVEQRELEETIENTALSYDDLSALVEKGAHLEWSDFEGHYYEGLWETGMCIREYTVKDNEFYIIVSAATSSAPLDSVLLVRELDDAEIELMEGNVEAAREFIAKKVNDSIKYQPKGS
ncbi:MAG: hypothetical protein IJW40_10400 [Clostridia bacterium]|nr:hypothetical protein [Clostridia bacterium]